MLVGQKGPTSPCLEHSAKAWMMGLSMRLTTLPMAATFSLSQVKCWRTTSQQ